MKVTFYIGLGISKLYQYLNKTESEGELDEIGSWESVSKIMKDSSKVYTTLLKTRYMLESDLITEGNKHFLIRV